MNKILTILFILVISFTYGLKAQRIELGYGSSFTGLEIYKAGSCL